ncbi:glycerate kinase [Thalassobacillus devorans]|uniref:glycerate kinase n=1 Tax=Thalassobacillus devorans TaxID=279813 RepID=UPI000A1CE163|nr:glycerate kinase [Thalassobacillus devorans]
MNFVVAPDSYKGSLTAIDVAKTIENAIISELSSATVVKVPMADGGEGFIDSLVFSTNNSLTCEYFIKGPLSQNIKSYYGLLKDSSTAVIEVANICGLTLVSADLKNPFLTTSYGVGEAILHLLDQGIRKFIIGLGGSATNDGGLGMLQALGVKFHDQNGQNVVPNGYGLKHIRKVNFESIDPRIKDCDIKIASDVENPLCGPKGATHIYGPQKGASPQQIKELDTALKHYAQIIKNEIDYDYENTLGAGAAGGLGFAFLIIGAFIESGAKLVAEATNLNEKIKNSDWVITGEGQTDYQTLFGKAPAHVAKIAKDHHKKTILVSGSLGEGIEELYELFVSCHATIPKPVSIATAMQEAKINLTLTTRNIARLLKFTS